MPGYRPFLALALGLVVSGAAAATEPPAAPANVVRWTTASEQDSFGFDVYRAEAAAGPYTRVTARPVLGAGTTDETHEYAFRDTSVASGRDYWYYVELISTDGGREKITPNWQAPRK